MAYDKFARRVYGQFAFLNFLISGWSAIPSREILLLRSQKLHDFALGHHVYGLWKVAEHVQRVHEASGIAGELGE